MSTIFELNVEPKTPSELIAALQAESPELDKFLGDEIYANHDPQYLRTQKQRFIETLEAHRKRVGERLTIIARAPGRLNAFLEYLDMCAGDHMSTTIDGDVPIAFSPRDDDHIVAFNMNPLFPETNVSIEEQFKAFQEAPLDSQIEDNWDNRSLYHPFAGRPKGHWMNYVLSPFIRTKWDLPELELRGADVTFGTATAPFRAGTSSSSAIVVLSFLVMFGSNKDRLPKWQVKDVCKMLGEAEWYVGTHGGANDQTTILRNPVNSVVYNRHSKAELDSTPLPFLKGIHVVLANSLWEVNKTTVGNQSFNMRKGWMQMGDEVMCMIVEAVTSAIAAGKAGQKGWLTILMRERFGFTPGIEPVELEANVDYWEKIQRNYRKFGSLCDDILGIPNSAISELVNLLPVKITPVDAGLLLGKDVETIERVYTKPKRAIGGYHLRTTARFFHKENKIGRSLERIFIEAEQRLNKGEITVDDPFYDAYRIRVGQMVDELQDALCFDFRTSTQQLDVLLTIARRGPGYLGGKLTGAGKGGCVSILVRAEDSDIMCEYLDREYYSKPEHFEFYMMVLEDDLKNREEGSVERESAQERLDNLTRALAHIKDQRRVITFSRGACAIPV
jgi:galactokinase